MPRFQSIKETYSEESNEINQRKGEINNMQHIISGILKGTLNISKRILWDQETA